MKRLILLYKERGIKGVLSHWFFYRHLIKGRNDDQIKFIVFGQGRTGSTLLTKLLDQHPDVFCDQEIFGSEESPTYLFPKLYIESNSRKPNTKGFKAYGFKVKIYQLFTDQNISNVKKLLETLYRDGWKFIFLYREDELSHNVSAVKAFSLGKWFVESTEDITDKKNSKLYVDPIQFEKSVIWRRRFAKMEKDCLSNIPHIQVSYEKDLLISENHQPVCDRIFDFLAVPKVKVVADVKKMNTKNLEDSIENYDEIKTLYKAL